MKRHLTLSLAAIIMLGSCKKDNSSNTTGIKGTYMLKYLTANTNSTTIGSAGDKSVTTSDYTTVNNQGTIVFGSLNLTSTGLAYTVDTLAYYSLYQNNQLVDSSSSPFTFTLPASNSVATYKLVGADSIYFPQGSLASGMGSTQSGPGGGRYTLNGNLLTINQNGSKDSTFQDSGETYHMNESIVATIVMVKQ